MALVCPEESRKFVFDLVHVPATGLCWLVGDLSDFRQGRESLRKYCQTTSSRGEVDTTQEDLSLLV